MQDLEMLRPVGWGAVITDQCQGSSMSMHHSQIKVLIADMRLLIFRQLEVCILLFWIDSQVSTEIYVS